jgi:hypothetical protein
MPFFFVCSPAFSCFIWDMNWPAPVFLVLFFVFYNNLVILNSNISYVKCRTYYRPMVFNEIVVTGLFVLRSIILPLVLCCFEIRFLIWRQENVCVSTIGHIPRLTESVNICPSVLFCKYFHNKIRSVSCGCESLFHQTVQPCSKSTEASLGSLVAKTAAGHC